MHFEKESDGKIVHELNINNENHTLGNLIQSLFYNKYVRQSKQLSYIGYTFVHPLEQTIIWKFVFINTNNDWFNFFINGLKIIKTDIENIKKEWQKKYKK
jgi:DNA-directed RNA polymerase subunit L